MEYKAVVFDMDGTLLDTLEDLADAMNKVLEGAGFPRHPLSAYRDFVGSGASQLVRRALPADARDDDTVHAACLRSFLAEYEISWNVKTRLYEGLSALLDGLAAKNIPMAVLTNKPQAFADLCMREFLSTWPFAVTMGQVPGVPVKPDPAGPRILIERLGVRPEEILYLGDTDVDMRTAVNAGMYPVGVLWGFRPQEELVCSGAATTIAHPLELMRFFA